VGGACMLRGYGSTSEYYNLHALITFFINNFNNYNMRKLLLLSLIAILYSCSQTVEDRISDEFKEFVNLNFAQRHPLQYLILEFQFF
jgi:hypothetical protein